VCTGSMRHIRRYVNDPALRPLLEALVATAGPSLVSQLAGPLTWVSPLAEQNYAEFCDDNFLRACGLGEDACDQLRSFWPAGGPCWDALATVPLQGGSRGVLLVEAKAHLGELKEKDATGATGASLTQIETSLREAAGALGASTGGAGWHRTYYQVCNRLAHLYFLNVKVGVPTWLAWLFIVDAPEWEDRACAGLWARRFAEVLFAVGLPSSFPLRDRIAVVFAPAAPETPTHAVP